MTGATFRQIDNWCSGGVFGEKFQKPGSGTRRRFRWSEVFETAVLKRVSDASVVLNASGTSGSVAVYALIVKALRGETVDGYAVTRTEISM
ncbi:MAG TPA: hypothetical protein VJQ25_02450, partial [Nitrospira sp.]|nr:hypothetical protein [Nitrospira sp.]